MSLRTHIRLAAAVFLLWSATMHGQGISLGPVATGSVNVPYATFPSLSSEPPCCSDFGIGVGGLASMGLELNSDVSHDVSLTLRTSLGGVQDLLWTRDQIGWRMVRSANGNKVYPAYSTYYVDISGSLLDMSLLANLNVGADSPWKLTLGASLVSPLSLQYDQYEIIDGEESTILADSRRPQRDVSKGDISAAATTYASMIAGVRYESPLSTTIRLMYDFTTSLALMPQFTSGGGSYSRYGLRASVGLLFDVSRVETTQQETPQISTDTPEDVPEIVEVNKPLEADTVESVTVDTTITVQTDTVAPLQSTPAPIDTSDTVTEVALAVVEPMTPEPQATPAAVAPKTYEVSTAYQLIPFVFFVPGTTSIDERTQAPFDGQLKNLDALVDTTWSQASYTKRHTLVNLHLLDIVGYRMTREYPESQLVINGYVNGRHSDSGRSNYGAERARIVAQYLQQNWGIASKRIITRSSEGLSPTACTYVLRDAQDIADAEEENTRCELTSPNEQRLLSSVVARVSIAEHQLVDREYSSIVRILSLQHEDATTVLRASAPPSQATIRSTAVTGYADRKGPDAVNQRISEQRARKLSALVTGNTGVLTIDWKSEGARDMRAPYTNDSPLGRFLNRCAEVRRLWTINP